MRHVIVLTIDSDRSPEELRAGIHDNVTDLSQGFIGDPDQEPLYGATLISVA